MSGSPVVGPGLQTGTADHHAWDVAVGRVSPYYRTATQAAIWCDECGGAWHGVDQCWSGCDTGSA